MKEVNAQLKYLRVSPRKVRLVADLVRGLTVDKARKQLALSKKSVSQSIAKLIESAVANAKENFKLDVDAKSNNLYIKKISVDKGPTLKRWLPRARGRATRINKRSSHISVILSEK